MGITVFSLIRWAISFTVFYIILCIPVKEMTLFNYIHQYTHPYTKKILGQAKVIGQKGIDKSLDFGKQLFQNSTPETGDEVKRKDAASKRDDNKNTFNEKYSEEEKALLKKILDNQY